MSRSAIEQALTSLIPRHDGLLPFELVELANSLLAQSRNKASTLKADEEIGRAYACANIACERLKQTLNLPQIEPRPPVPPKTYKKLYGYLESALAVQKRGRGRPRKVRTDSPPPVKQPRGRPSPAKALAASKNLPPPSGGDTPRPQRQTTILNEDIAPWIHPVIRTLCKEFKAPAAAPHILAGVTTILSELDNANKNTITKITQVDHVSSLIVAIYFFVTTRLRGKETSGRDYQAQRKRILDFLATLRGDEQLLERVSKKGSGKIEEDWAGWVDESTKDIDTWLFRISKSTWLQSDWFENIVEGAGVSVTQSSAITEDGSEAEDGIFEGENFARAGLGTMIQDRVDYLSPRNRAGYKKWKDDIIARIKIIEMENELPDDGIMDES